MLYLITLEIIKDHYTYRMVEADSIEEAEDKAEKLKEIYRFKEPDRGWKVIKVRRIRTVGDVRRALLRSNIEEDYKTIQEEMESEDVPPLHPEGEVKDSDGK